MSIEQEDRPVTNGGLNAAVGDRGSHCSETLEGSPLPLKTRFRRLKPDEKGERIDLQHSPKVERMIAI
ncbi:MULTISPECIES: hypothetical protein [unclassified Sporolactobacillus]|jgi:hypothetical protein|uniref:hypothetical protein n=1 Tax=unclassified Sporolactobacillus TaxID=2628533 RepID=UPI002367B722|nr:hypothetical protein [Sporolactobacillus sp. CQH2019]MDD9147014.1 hypothetical protein [Sporolactobacillus sp. CQH2019]